MNSPTPSSAMRHGREPVKLSDFSTDLRVVTISAMALVIGVLSAFVALALLKLIGLFTNLFFFQTWNTALVTPSGHHLGAFVVAVPVIGGLVIGFMARYGSERIRGHGIPEAIEAILMNGSRVEPKVAFLKPLSAAISIGSGGPFGAEGPIIMTGGAFGSMIAQFFHLTSAERKTLLVAGAAGGMAATFAAPLASLLLAVELLLFEWKPRSLIPVGVAAAAATVVRRYIIGLGPLFPTSAHPIFIGPDGILGCIVAGILAGALSALLTGAVYAAEDTFKKLPIHWMWWPALGGLAIGIGGLIFPQALGVGYDVIESLIRENAPTKIILGILIVKSLIWSISLGSGTSGGVLAPLLMMGGALGGIEAGWLPAEGIGFWPLISMGAILGGTMRVPFCGVIFVLELTHDVNILLPLIVATVIAYTFTVLVLGRSILTEKIARRGYHLTREYAIDPLEILFVREVMPANVIAIPAHSPLKQLLLSLQSTDRRRHQRLYPVVDEKKRLTGVLTEGDIHRMQQTDGHGKGASMEETVRRNPVVAYPDEPLRVVVYRMAETGLTRFPVIDRDGGAVLGVISLKDLLVARSRNLDAEQRRERVLHPRIFFPRQSRRDSNDRSAASA
ncbi:MAG TPA: chloride channel protein [Candidatus Binatia bacterium]